MADYSPIRKLGEGYFGEVWLAEDKALGGERAVKFVRESDLPDPTNFYLEPHILKELEHQNIVRVTDAGRTDSNKLYIAMEYVPDGSIDDKFKGAPTGVNTTVCAGSQVCRALEYAHTNEYLHRDIKAANILVGGENLFMLSDFGLATRRTDAGGGSPDGYWTHMAPEVIQGADCSVQSDVYSLGVTLYKMVNGETLLPEFSDGSELQDMILSGSYPDRRVYQPFVPSNLRQVINKAMHMDPDSRFSSARNFRLALERITPLVDWQMTFRKDETIFMGSGNGWIYTITTSSRRGHHECSIESTSPNGSTRQSRVHSGIFSAQSDFTAHLRSVMSAITIDGLLPKQ